MARAPKRRAELRDPKDAGKRPPFDEKEQAAPGSQADMNESPDYGAESYVGHARLKGRRALITGGDSGIGRAVALAFAREGADIAFTHMAEEAEDAEETIAIVEAEGRKVHAIEVDFADVEDCERAVKECVSKLGGIDIIVNNAALQGEEVEGIEDLDPARVLKTFQVNVVAMFAIVRAALPELPEGACIINVASIQAYDPSAEILDYASTKGAVVTFTKGLAQELIERGIRVNAVAPGPVWTPLIPQSFKEKKVKTFGAHSPMKRPAQPAELAPAFVFLASDEGRYVNGEILGVTGGRLLA
jgi:NAD(P)-dependent dehydrogenase (short-subunit alcohol dehydrogenase family)